MIDLEFVERLIRALDASGVDHVEIERGGTRVRISKTPPMSSNNVTPAPLPAAAASASLEPASGDRASGAEEPDEEPVPSNLVEITSPMVGTFYRSSSPGSDPFTEVGSRIAEGDTLCIIEAMKLMNELEADAEGIVREICVANGEPVEYGQVLFRVEPA